MKRLFLAVGLLFLFTAEATAQGLPLAPPPQLGLDPDRLDRIVELVEEAVDREEVAGAVTLVARLGRVGHLEAIGFRDRERGCLLYTSDAADE